ncbi:MAG: DegT/DnrJ/EryC1/StrS family aminotransferase [Phycisphaerales bacterium]|jgi:perosamine synthetase
MTQATASTLALDGGAATFDSPVAFMRPQLQPQDVEAAHEVLKSGMLRAAGKCGELETRFAEASQAKHALACANGTCALQLAYRSLFQRGDEVLVPAWTYIATASMLVAEGMTPVWVDSLEDTMQIDVADAAKKVTSKTRGIAATHLYGMPVDVHAIAELAKANDLKVVYDCAQSHLATVDGEGIGTFGDACTYSFYATKNLGTGEGGMITVNDDTLGHDVALLRSHGETDKYLHERIGFNYRMNDITGAIGCSRLDRLLDETNARRAAADHYDTVLGAIDGVLPPGRTKGADSAWHLYTVKLDLDQFTCDRDAFTKALSAEGVPTAVHYPRSLTHQPAFKDYVSDHPPVAEALASKVFCLPMHHELHHATIDRIGEAVAKVAAAYRR